MGIKNVDIDSEGMHISYDLLQVTAEQIETAIDKSGVILGDKLSQKLKRAFVHYVEESELDNLEQSGGKHNH